MNRLNLPKWPQPSQRKQSPHPTYNSHTRRCSQPWALAEDIIDDTQLQRCTYREENTSFTLPCTLLPPTEARTSPSIPRKEENFVSISMTLELQYFPHYRGNAHTWPLKLLHFIRYTLTLHKTFYCLKSLSREHWVCATRKADSTSVLDLYTHHKFRDRITHGLFRRALQNL